MPKTIIILLFYIANTFANVNCNIVSLVNLRFSCNNLISCSGIGSITLKCTGNPQYTITINQGSSGIFTQRTLINQSNSSKVVPYNIYTTPNKLNIFGDGTQGSTAVKDSGNNSTINFYGFIDNIDIRGVREGYYSDNLLVNIIYN
ncbi:MAG: Spore Coat Protein domain [Bacteroidota bacterium]|jgi:spore coat protein U-like protein